MSESVFAEHTKYISCQQLILLVTNIIRMAGEFISTLRTRKVTSYCAISRGQQRNNCVCAEICTENQMNELCPRFCCLYDDFKSSKELF